MQSKEKLKAKKEDIVQLEWGLFDQVNNLGGRASCQDDYETFYCMRMSQFEPWTEALTDSYFSDVKATIGQGRNIISEKYAWMMNDTSPESFDEIKGILSKLDDEAVQYMNEIVEIQVIWMEQYSQKYWALSFDNRVIHTKSEQAYQTSFETYLRGELHTYSSKTLTLYYGFIKDFVEEGKNLIYLIMNQTVQFYGYHNLEEADCEKKPIVISKILKHIDCLFQKGDNKQAVQTMKRWIEIFEVNNEYQYELTIQNELIGFYGKGAMKEEGLLVIQRAVWLVKVLEQEDTVSGATTWLNIATALKNFGDEIYSEKFFIQAEQIYNKYLEPYDYRMAALYNNQALLYSDLKKYDEAKNRYFKALSILEHNNGTGAEMALTYINLAHLYDLIGGKERDSQVDYFVKKSITLLEVEKGLHNSYHAYICNTSAKSLERLGYKKESIHLRQLSEKYYNGVKGK